MQGDVRMGLSENPHKVANIVAGQADELAAMYVPRLQAWPHATALPGDTWEVQARVLGARASVMSAALTGRAQPTASQGSRSGARLAGDAAAGPGRPRGAPWRAP
jgi:hypothetical protein